MALTCPADNAEPFYTHIDTIQMSHAIQEIAR
jgi:hypothetical protein